MMGDADRSWETRPWPIDEDPSLALRDVILKRRHEALAAGCRWPLCVVLHPALIAELLDADDPSRSTDLAYRIGASLTLCMRIFGMRVIPHDSARRPVVTMDAPEVIDRLLGVQPLDLARWRTLSDLPHIEVAR